MSPLGFGNYALPDLSPQPTLVALRRCVVSCTGHAQESIIGHDFIVIQQWNTPLLGDK